MPCMNVWLQDISTHNSSRFARLDRIYLLLRANSDIDSTRFVQRYSCNVDHSALGVVQNQDPTDSYWDENTIGGIRHNISPSLAW